MQTVMLSSNSVAYTVEKPNNGNYCYDKITCKHVLQCMQIACCTQKSLIWQTVNTSGFPMNVGSLSQVWGVF